METGIGNIPTLATITMGNAHSHIGIKKIMHYMYFAKSSTGASKSGAM